MELLEMSRSIWFSFYPHHNISHKNTDKDKQTAFRSYRHGLLHSAHLLRVNKHIETIKIEYDCNLFTVFCNCLSNLEICRPSRQIMDPHSIVQNSKEQHCGGFLETKFCANYLKTCATRYTW